MPIIDHDEIYLPTIGGKKWIRVTLHPINLIAWAGYISAEDLANRQKLRDKRAKANLGLD